MKALQNWTLKTTGDKMNEKNNIAIVIVLAVAVFICGAAFGFLFGRGNSVGSAGLELTNGKLTETVGSLREELERERIEFERERAINAEERAINEREGRIHEEERKLIKSALESCGRTGSGIQGIVAKMEIINGLIRNLERGAYGDSDLSGGE